MKYAPPTIAAADYPIARKPAFGGEASVFISTEQSLELGEYEIAAVNSGVWTADSVNAIPAAGAYIAAVVSSPTGMSGGSASVVLTVTGKDEDNGAASATATFTPPNYAENKNNDFQIGYGVDVELAGDKKWKTITAVTVSCQADAAGATIKLLTMPSSASFKRIGCTTDLRFTTRSQVPKSIACGMDAAAFTKPGRSEQPTITIAGKQKGFGDGLARFDGRPCTVMVQVDKEGTVVTDNLYFTSAYLRVTPEYGDGDAEATTSADGVYENLALMIAP